MVWIVRLPPLGRGDYVQALIYVPNPTPHDSSRRWKRGVDSASGYGLKRDCYIPWQGFPQAAQSP